MRRFDGALAWATLIKPEQDRLGAIALELVAAWQGESSLEHADGVCIYAAAAIDLADMLEQTAAMLVPELDLDPERTPVDELPGLPSLIAQTCRVCGRTEHEADAEQLAFAEPGLCARCGGPAA